MTTTEAVIALAAVGAAAQMGGVIVVVAEITSDRRHARELIDKQRQFEPVKRGRPRRVHPSELGGRAAIGTMHPNPQQYSAAGMASLINAHNGMVRDIENLIETRTALILSEIDEGDQELRDVQRYQLAGSLDARVWGIVLIVFGIAFSLASTIVGASS